MWGQAELNLVCTTLGDSLKVPGRFPESPWASPSHGNRAIPAPASGAAGEEAMALGRDAEEDVLVKGQKLH